MCASIRSMLLVVHGMDIKKLLKGRILMRFFHVIDHQRAVKGCPWSFDKNIFILNVVGLDENPMNIDLNWCEFFIHVHNLSLSRMNLGFVIHIGNRVGRFREMETDEAGRAWGISLRIRVAINVNNPLKMALKIRTTGGDEHLVHFTYEMLPNFCYLCGRMEHIEKYCEIKFEEGFIDPREDMPYGPWLRAPTPSRGRFQVKKQPAASGVGHSSNTEKCEH
ncbi:UNVERIFIED_CONTAM: hypothetical protein Slati_2506600 [Sesamum latifolium]|uniref:Zinc knuckle CX2CX4HX4C domain-containing protein n=1 Tax=Sesamum latifolium TaxID=2727402 RepID=A0AAW2WHW5_9LAMI